MSKVLLEIGSSFYDCRSFVVSWVQENIQNGKKDIIGYYPHGIALDSERGLSLEFMIIMFLFSLSYHTLNLISQF